MTELVTVVIPVYNTYQYLEECVDSVINQKYTNLEIILVDDESPDASPALCDEYARRDSRIKVIHRKNGGLSAARNSGIRAAGGKYITFVDSDDIIDTEMISEMVDIANKEAAQIVKSTLVRVDVKENCDSSAGGYSVVSPYDALTMIYNGPPQIISGCGKLFDISLFDEILFPEGLNHEDEFTLPKLYHKAKKIVMCDSVRYFYMQRPGDSIMRSSFSSKKMDVLVVAEDRIEFFDSCGYKELSKLAVRDYFCHLLNLMQKVKNTEYEKEYTEIMDKMEKIPYSALSFGQKLRLFLIRIKLYDFIYR